MGIVTRLADRKIGVRFLAGAGGLFRLCSVVPSGVVGAEEDWPIGWVQCSLG